MNRHIARVILFISIFLCVHFNIAGGTILPSELSRPHIIGNGTHIDSFDFRIENIDYDDIHLGSITTLHRCGKGSFPLFSNGGQLIYTHNGIRVKVIYGNAALSFTGSAGEVVTLASGAGNSFEFVPESFTIEASGTNKKDVLVQFDGVEYYIEPGKRTQIVEIEIIQEAKSHHLIPNIQGNTPVVIFGSAHLDVSTIDIGSLSIENLAMRVNDKTHNFSTIGHVNYDNHPDLVVMFDDISPFLYKDISYATLKGNLSDGTIINGKDNILIIH